MCRAPDSALSRTSAFHTRYTLNRYPSATAPLCRATCRRSAGIEQTKIFNELEVIYRNVKSDANFDYQHTQQSIDAIMSRFYGTVISKQIFGSNWYAHYKFYCEFEKAWVEEELNLTLKDKIPLSLCFLAGLVIIFTIAVIWKTS
nr:hypothetical protein [Klebsiella grimontii]